MATIFEESRNKLSEYELEIRNLMSIGGTVPVVAQYAGAAERNHASLSETLSEVEAKYDILTSNRSKRLVLDLFGGHREREQRTIAKVIKSQANNEAKAINIKTKLNQRISLISSFHAGRFPPENALEKESCLTREQATSFHPNGLRKTYTPYIERGSCANIQCDKHCDSLEGDSSYHRQQILKKICERVTQITMVDTKKLSKKDKVSQWLGKIQDDFIRISNEVVATAVYFPYSQYETKLLIDQFMILTLMVGDVIDEDPDAKMKAIDGNLEGKIKHELMAVKKCIAAVVHHHDRVHNELRAAKEKALSGHCIEKECRARVMRLLSSEVKPSPDIVFSWICENCVKFSYSELRTFLSKSEQKFVDLSTQNCTPETKSCGGFGEVSVVDLTQMDENVRNIFKHELGSKIAIKRLLINHSIDGTSIARREELESRYCKRFLREIIVWRQLDHPNLLPLLGTCITSKNSLIPSLVTPYINNGNLEEYLLVQPPTDENMADRLRYMLDVASALEYMHNHSLRIVHGDLKPNNILISYDERTNSRRAYLADFGLSVLSSYRGLTSEVHGYPSYMAPELLEATDRVGCLAEFEYFDLAKPTTWSDIYAFGCTLFHVITNELPFKSLINKHDPLSIPRPEGVKDRFQYNFIQNCWRTHPATRPTAKAAKEAMSFILKMVPQLAP